MDAVFEGLGRDLRRAGLKVQKVKGWQTRGVPGTFAPRGVLNHHTASASGNLPCLGIVTVGRSDLSGPLCNILLGRDGTVVLIAAGRANHAGLGGPFRGIPQDSGNAFTIGIEWENNGVGEKYSNAQLRAGAVLNAILLRRLGRTAFMCFDHKEWTTRKIDRSLDPKAFRKSVRRAIKEAA